MKKKPWLQVKPDYRYQNKKVAKFINHVMRKGKKALARKIVYSAFEIIKEKIDQDPVRVFENALRNVTPSKEVRPRRVGGATYQVPRKVRPKRGKSLAMRWLIEAAKNRSGENMKQKLAGELIDAFHNKGGAINKKKNMHRMAEANKAFAHFGW